jgi:hypothetical protein
MENVLCVRRVPYPVVVVRLCQTIIRHCHRTGRVCGEAAREETVIPLILTAQSQSNPINAKETRVMGSDHMTICMYFFPCSAMTTYERQAPPCTKHMSGASSGLEEVLSL